MIFNTRFNPTVNGYLHLGHLYNALINQGEARRSGGKFGIRWDDDQRYWNWMHGANVGMFKAQMIEDLAWFGIKPDYFHSQDLMSGEIDRLLEEMDYTPAPQAFAPNRGAAEVIGQSVTYYPYVESITADKVLFDFIDGVTWCIRGIDLLTEDCLYRHFCEVFTIACPRLTYIPRLLFDGDEVSKTAGNFKLKDFRKAEVKPFEVVELLAYDCLKSPGAGWFVENIKPQPVLSAWAKGMLYGVHP